MSPRAISRKSTTRAAPPAAERGAFRPSMPTARRRRPYPGLCPVALPACESVCVRISGLGAGAALGARRPGDAGGAGGAPLPEYPGPDAAREDMRARI